MKRILDVLEVLGVVAVQGRDYELCASADFNLEQETNKLHGRLEACLRPVHSVQGLHEVPSWVPKEVKLVENASDEEALDLARDIFRRWVRKTREKAPSLHQPA